jgi:2,3-bisphosphoglycerate-independent phosphoglycerate mutase
MDIKKEKQNVAKPIILIILDGWGINQAYPGNAITSAQTPFMDSLIQEYPATTIRASGESVGLPWGKAGNSEVGHLNLGLGRVLYQDLPRINRDIANNNFFKNPILLKVAEHVLKHNSSLHIMGLLSNGGVHSSIDHLNALLKFAKKKNIEKIFIHPILDGRDVSLDSGINFIKGLERTLKEYNVGKIATVAGRIYAMDRNNNWSRTQKYYDACVLAKGNKVKSALDAVESSYRKKIYDEELSPSVIYENDSPVTKIKDNDAVIFFNFRPDRARQITKAIIYDSGSGLERNIKINNLFFASFTEYEKDLNVEVVFPPEEIKETLGDVLSKAGLKQLRIAETEKYAHVTYFFNGGREEMQEGEDHVLVPSPDVESYDLKPEMSAGEITKKVVEALNKNIYDFILINYANSDMVGHTGNLEAAIKAIEFLDVCVKKVVGSALDAGACLLITADHGNAHVMFNMQTGQVDKEHTNNPVPFILVSKEYQGKNFGWQNFAGGDLSTITPQGILADVAPTVLKLFNLKKPEVMTGESLI